MNIKITPRSEYKFEDFVLDDSFINFVNNKNKADIEEWEKWFSQNPKNSDIALEAKIFISQLRFKKQELTGDFVNAEWLKLNKRLQLNAISPPLNKRAVLRRKIGRYAAAASILMFFASATYYFSSISKTENPIDYHELIVNKGEVKNTLLPDGTLVFINSDSKLKYNDNFGKKHREVILEGEAWFDVKHNAEIPFIVHTQEIDIKVLGTAFNVYAYPNENIFRTSLERGKISVSKGDEKTQELLINQTYTLLKDSKQDEISETENIQSHSSWKDGETVFMNQPFTDILRELERSHDVTFHLLNEKVGSIKYTGTFSTKDGINTILKVLKLPMAFEYEIVNDTITIK